MKQIVTDACAIYPSSTRSAVELKPVGRAGVVKPKRPQTNSAFPSVDFSSTDGTELPDLRYQDCNGCKSLRLNPKTNPVHRENPLQSWSKAD